MGAAGVGFLGAGGVLREGPAAAGAVARRGAVGDEPEFRGNSGWALRWRAAASQRGAAVWELFFCAPEGRGGLGQGAGRTTERKSLVVGRQGMAEMGEAV